MPPSLLPLLMQLKWPIKLLPLLMQLKWPTKLLPPMLTLLPWPPLLTLLPWPMLPPPINLLPRFITDIVKGLQNMSRMLLQRQRIVTNGQRKLIQLQNISSSNLLKQRIPITIVHRVHPHMKEKRPQDLVMVTRSIKLISEAKHLMTDCKAQHVRYMCSHMQGLQTNV